MTGLNLKPVLASSEAIQREIKKRLGVGADTIGTLDEEKGFQVVDENAEDTNLDEGAEDEASIIRFVNQVKKKKKLDADALVARPAPRSPARRKFSAGSRTNMAWVIPRSTTWSRIVSFSPFFPRAFC